MGIQTIEELCGGVIWSFYVFSVVNRVWTRCWTKTIEAPVIWNGTDRERFRKGSEIWPWYENEIIIAILSISVISTSFLTLRVSPLTITIPAEEINLNMCIWVQPIINLPKFSANFVSNNCEATHNGIRLKSFHTSTQFDSYIKLKTTQL